MLGIAIEQETKTFTVREMWQALEQNGLKHLRSQWYVDGTEDGTAKGACAIGQAAYNLGVPHSSDLDYGRNEDGDDNLSAALSKFATPDKWRQYGEDVSAAIIGVNDALRLKKDGRIARRINNRGAYYRYTYKEVVRIAHEILEPYFEETITLPVYRY